MNKFVRRIIRLTIVAILVVVFEKLGGIDNRFLLFFILLNSLAIDDLIRGNKR